MADEEVVDEGAEETESSGRLGLILMVAGLLVAIGGGLGIYFFVIAPKFTDEIVAEDDYMDDGDYIPLNPVYYPFESVFTNLMRDGNSPASMLIYKVSFECTDQATYDVIDKYKARFVDMINKLHDSRTREEVDDILLFKESVQRQAMQKGNDILQRIVRQSVEDEKERSNYRITSVLHESCSVSDQPG